MPWIEDFLEQTSNINSSELFRRWGAISAIAAALERKVWTKTSTGNLYPNIYTFLVAPPGVGKTVVTSRVQRLLESIETHHTAASSLTAASLIDDLKDSTRQFANIKAAQPITRYHSLYVVSDELGVLLPKYETEFMSKLTAIYDCFNYRERRRTNNTNFTIENPQLNILAGCTPSYLMNTLPDGAWDQGFLSRCFLIFNSESRPVDLFAQHAQTTITEKELVKRLKVISLLSGEFIYTDEAKAALWKWEQSGRQPMPEHPKLINYNTRRLIHLVKLSMILSAAESSNLVVDAEHVNQALDVLIEAEFFMPEIFKAMKLGGEASAYEDTWYHVLRIYMTEKKKPVAEARIIQFLQERVPVYNIMRVIETMERTGLIKCVATIHGKTYIPAEKHSNN